MIKDGSISYSSVASPLLLWEPEHSVLNTFFIGFLTTILSVQATGVVFDLLLGCKPAAQVTLSDLHSLLLVWSSSPLAVLNNVTRKDWITRKYYGGDIPVGTRIGRSQMSVKRRVVAKLFLLLSIGPIINVIAVAVVLERETHISLRGSGFGGIGWGVNVDLKVAESHQVTETCKNYNVTTVFLDGVVVQFSSCNIPFIFDSFETFPGYGLVSVGVRKQSEIFVIVEMFGWSVSAPTVPQLFANDTLFQVKHALTNKTAAVLVDKGIELMAAECAVGDVVDGGEEFFPPQPPPESMLQYTHSKKLPCNSIGPISEEEVHEKILRIGKTLREHITFVDADRLDLYIEKEQNEEVSFIGTDEVESIVLVRRRQRYWSVPIVALICCFVLAIRLITVSFLNNDVSIALEMAVKRGLGMGIFESMLQNGEGLISYNNKFQLGERAHYGLMRLDLPMVENFEGGILGEDLKA